MSDFASRLSGLLDEKEWNRADLARAAQIPYHRLNPWFIRAGAKPNGPDLLAVARVLNVSEKYLVHGGEARPFDAGESLERRVQELDAEEKREVEQFLDFVEARRSKPQK